MAALLLVGAWVLYGISASLPFLDITADKRYIFGIIIAILASILWTTISLNVPKPNIAYWGLVYDIGLTVVFFATPVLWLGLRLSGYNIAGMLLILLGLGLLKV